MTFAPRGVSLNPYSAERFRGIMLLTVRTPLVDTMAFFNYTTTGVQPKQICPSAAYAAAEVRCCTARVVASTGDP